MNDKTFSDCMNNLTQELKGIRETLEVIYKELDCIADREICDKLGDISENLNELIRK